MQFLTLRLMLLYVIIAVNPFTDAQSIVQHFEQRCYYVPTRFKNVNIL